MLLISEVLQLSYLELDPTNDLAMSRRSSTASSIESTPRGDNGDPLMKDCYELRRRLLETERSLQGLVVSSGKKESDGGDGSR